MKIKADIKQDTVTDYLEKLDDLVNDEGNLTNYLRDAGTEMHFEYIEPRMPKWNPNLMYSPLEPDHREVRIGEVSTIELLYTGFTEEAKSHDLPQGVWSEFGDNVQGILERDYAYYQETTRDPIAPPSGAKSPFFVKRGTSAYNTGFYYKNMAFVDRLMHLARWERTSRYIDLYDYME